MTVLGLDIGTTTVSAVVVRDGAVLTAKTLKNDAFLPDRPVWEKAQDVGRITEIALGVVTELREAYPQIERIGLTGQQHGIVYLNAAGEPLSPLYTWQDGRGDLPYDGQQSYAARLSALTGYPLATGFGLVTHFYNLCNRLVPENAATFCTIHDYLAMRLAGLTVPQLDASDAASFGCFDLEKGCFDLPALERAGIDTAILPPLAKTPCIGGQDLPVYAAIGDNQASFLGATNGDSGCMLINVGTGSQFSLHSPTLMTCDGLETRPFPLGGCLLVGSSLCGGRAYALLEQFFRQVAQMLGSPVESCYDAMSALLEGEPPADPVKITPLFQGTRADPTRRAVIENLGTDNFTPRSLLYGMLNGMTEELHAMYRRYTEQGGQSGALYGSGNGLRKNPRLRECFERAFGLPLTLSANEEEAACGAAFYAAAH